jgi:hypothetical protein
LEQYFSPEEKNVDRRNKTLATRGTNDKFKLDSVEQHFSSRRAKIWTTRNKTLANTEQTMNSNQIN